MIIKPEHADTARSARAAVATAFKAALEQNINPFFYGHAMLIEAMKMILNCPADRAEELADGLMVIANADQTQYVTNGFLDVVVRVTTGCLKSDSTARHRMMMLGVTAIVRGPMMGVAA